MKSEGGRPGRVRQSAMRYVYGPVVSRRLGLSLGINVIPHKTCTLDCVYCQCGRTTRKTLRRQSFFPVKDIVADVRAALTADSLQPTAHSRKSGAVSRKPKAVGYLTFSGEGEPTLNKDIGTIIRRLKREFRVPVAVITNSTLIPDPEVRRDLAAADLVVPSLDAADQRTFAKVDRCHRDIRVADIIEGLEKFRRSYRGKLWLEIMLVKGINDSVEHIVALRKVVHEIRPDRVQLNTVVRPPAERFARPVSRDDLVQIQHLFGPDTDIADEPRTPDPRLHGNRKSAICNPQSAMGVSACILATVHGRPVTRDDLVRSLGVAPRLLDRALRSLERSGRIRRVRYAGKTFFEPA